MKKLQKSLHTDRVVSVAIRHSDNADLTDDQFSHCGRSPGGKCCSCWMACKRVYKNWNDNFVTNCTCSGCDKESCCVMLMSWSWGMKSNPVSLMEDSSDVTLSSSGK